MDDDVHISQAAKALGVTPGYLKQLERQRRIPTARRNAFGDRLYSPFDLAFLRMIGVGQGRIRQLEEIVGEEVLR